MVEYKDMLTQRDVELIEKIINEAIEEKTRLLPTKDEFFTKMDEVIGELQTMRDEHTILGHQVSDHETRITDLEENKKSGHFVSAT